MTKDMEKAVVLNSVFTSDFTSKISFCEYQGKSLEWQKFTLEGSGSVQEIRKKTGHKKAGYT